VGRQCNQFAASLSRIGPNAKPAIPLLLELLDRQGVNLFFLAGTLESVGAGKEAQEQVLLRLLQGDNAVFRVQAASRLLGFEPGNEAAMAALIDVIRSRSYGAVSAIHELGRLGPAAEAAIPVLRQTKDSKENGQLADALRTAATEVLAKIEVPPK